MSQYTGGGGGAMKKFFKLGGYIFLLACLNGCRSTDKTGTGTLESSTSSSQPSLQLSQIAVYYPSADPFEGEGLAKPIFPAAFAAHAGAVKLMRQQFVPTQHCYPSKRNTRLTGPIIGPLLGGTSINLVL